MHRYFAIPLGMVFLFAAGFWSAKKLRVRHPLRWFLGIVVVWDTIRFSLYRVAVSRGKQYGFIMPTLTAALLCVPSRWQYCSMQR